MPGSINSRGPKGPEENEHLGLLLKNIRYIHEAYVMQLHVQLCGSQLEIVFGNSSVLSTPSSEILASNSLQFQICEASLSNLVGVEVP